MRPEHLMLDLETWGTRPGSAIRSIGAVMFDLDGKVGETFYRNISRQSCLDVGLVVDPATEKWWSEQSVAARAALEPNQKPLRQAAAEFTTWARQQGAKFIWGHGASFDPPLWEAASAAVNVDLPWSFWNIRDTRTVHHLFDYDTREKVRRGVYHNALDDALYQVEGVVAALRKGRPAAVVESVFG